MSYTCHTIKTMTKPDRISARLSEDAAKKLKSIIASSKSNMSEVIEKAISHYYNEVVKSEKYNLGILEEVGFIGFEEAVEDLSTEYKKYLTHSLNKKY